MTKITLLSYCHAAHKKWIPFWTEQVCNQTFKDFEILFVAHNWGDDEWANYKEFAEIIKDSRLFDMPHLIRFESFSSEPIIGRVINYANDYLVETPYTAHHDIDDLIHPDRMKLQAEFIDKNPDVDFINARAVGFHGQEPNWGDLYEHDKSSQLLEYLTNPQLNTHAEIKGCFDRGYNCLAHGLMIYKRDVMSQIGGFTLDDVKTTGRSPDWETWQKAMRAGFKFHRLPELLMYWRLDSSSIRK